MAGLVARGRGSYYLQHEALLRREWCRETLPFTLAAEDPDGTKDGLLPDSQRAPSLLPEPCGRLRPVPRTHGPSRRHSAGTGEAGIRHHRSPGVSTGHPLGPPHSPEGLSGLGFFAAGSRPAGNHFSYEASRLCFHTAQST